MNPGKILSLQKFLRQLSIQSLLYEKSSPALLVANQTFKVILHCFIILFPGMSAEHSFALYVFYIDSRFYNSPIFSRNESSFKKISRVCLQPTSGLS